MSRLLLLSLFALGALVAQEPSEHKENAAEAAHSEEHSEGPGEIWKWANFAILAGGLGYLLVKNLPGVFAARTKEIRHGISEAQQMKQDAERRSAEMDARLRSLGADIEKFRTESAAEMQQEGDRIAQETAEQIKKIEEHSAVEIDAAAKTERRKLKEYAAELALGLAEERLRARMTNDTEATLVDAFVRDLERESPQSKGSNN